MSLNKVGKNLKEHWLFGAFLLFMAVIYVYAMFTNGPWYDELYTYYYFISRGPVYAAIHWPVPNNHVGYSVISAFLDFFGNSYIGLRGVSVIAALINLGLIYKLALKASNKSIALMTSALYACAYLGYRLAIQGRGYTLAVTCLLVAASSVYNVCHKEDSKKDYVFFAISLTLGLYIVASSLYFVVPICLTGGLYLLFNKEYNRLLKLFLSGVVAAFCTTFLYCLIWLAIGANLISKDAGSAYYGLSQIKVLFKTPFGSLKTGIDYMTSTPYIQSIDRKSCITGLFGYFKELFGQFYDRIGLVTLILAIAVMVINAVLLCVDSNKTKTDKFFSLFNVVFTVVVPLMLIVQSVHPYKRVLSFILVPVVLGVCQVIWLIAGAIKGDRGRECFVVALMAGAVFWAGYSVLSPYYRAPLADRENNLEELFKQADTDKIDTMFYTDDYQKYVLKFYHDVTPVEAYTPAEADYIVIGPEQLDENYSAPIWPLFYPYSQELLDEVGSNMEVVASTSKYSLYKRK